MFKKLLGEKLLVEQVIEEEKEEKTESGLYIPRQAKQPSMNAEGKVAQVGTDCKHVSEGDNIIYDRMAVREVALDGKTYVILNEESVVGIL